MYENYTRQALPSKTYRELLGTAICVFNANNAFIIENILNTKIDSSLSWHSLIDKESGKLAPIVKQTINDDNISELFAQIIKMRNRIIHSYQITGPKNEQILCTKVKAPDNKQFVITVDYLMNFIKENEKLSTLLHAYRKDIKTL